MHLLLFSQQYHSVISAEILVYLAIKAVLFAYPSQVVCLIKAYLKEEKPAPLKVFRKILHCSYLCS